MGIPQTISNRDYVLDIVDEAGVVCDRRPVSGYLTVGRGSEEFKPDLPVPDECTSASRRHAVLDLRGSRPILEDQSRFGTIVNGILLERGMTELFNGDEIIFGSSQTGWRVRFRIIGGRYTEEADPLELLAISEDPRQILIGLQPIEENLGHDAFYLLKFLSNNNGRWYTTNRLVDMLWPDPDSMPIAAKQALSHAKKRVNDHLRQRLQGQDAIVAAPFKGYRLKPVLDITEPGVAREV
jgi:hypothetical protein